MKSRILTRCFVFLICLSVLSVSTFYRDASVDFLPQENSCLEATSLSGFTFSSSASDGQAIPSTVFFLDTFEITYCTYDYLFIRISDDRGGHEFVSEYEYGGCTCGHGWRIFVDVNCPDIRYLTISRQNSYGEDLPDERVEIIHFYFDFYTHDTQAAAIRGFCLEQNTFSLEGSQIFKLDEEIKLVPTLHFAFASKEAMPQGCAEFGQMLLDKEQSILSSLEMFVRIGCEDEGRQFLDWQELSQILSEHFEAIGDVSSEQDDEYFEFFIEYRFSFQDRDWVIAANFYLTSQEYENGNGGTNGNNGNNNNNNNNGGNNNANNGNNNNGNNNENNNGENNGGSSGGLTGLTDFEMVMIVVVPVVIILGLGYLVYHFKYKKLRQSSAAQQSERQGGGKEQDSGKAPKATTTKKPVSKKLDYATWDIGPKPDMADGNIQDNNIQDYDDTVDISDQDMDTDIEVDAIEEGEIEVGEHIDIKEDNALDMTRKKADVKQNSNQNNHQKAKEIYENLEKRAKDNE